MEKVNMGNNQEWSLRVTEGSLAISQIHSGDCHAKPRSMGTSLAMTALFFFFITLFSACGAGGTEVGNPGGLPAAAYSPAPISYIPDPSANSGNLPTPDYGTNSPDNSGAPPPVESKITLGEQTPNHILYTYYKAGGALSTNLFILRNVSGENLENIYFNLTSSSLSKNNLLRSSCPSNLASLHSCVVEITRDESLTADLDLEIFYQSGKELVPNLFTLRSNEANPVSPVNSVQVYPSFPHRNENFILNLKTQNLSDSLLYNSFVSFKIPEGLQLIASNGLCDRNDQQLLCKTGDISAHSEINLRFSLKVSQTGNSNLVFQILSPNHLNETGESMETNLNVIP